jgi:prepilin-type N-terminal cleavage/methylation domain-containing protein
MKTNHKTRRGFTLVELLVVIVIIAALAGLTAPMVIRQRKKADQTEAVSNARQIGLALFEFENEYGSYPDATTATAVTNATGSTLTLGSTASNDYFRQLLAGNFTQSEKIFYAKIPSAVKPDDNIKGDDALKQGEVGFGYMMKGTAGFNAAGNPSRPLAVTPLFNNATDGTFDPAPFDSKAIVLRMDNSVTSINVKLDKKINLGGTNSDILTKGADTVWGDMTDTPTIVAPKIKSSN